MATVDPDRKPALDRQFHEQDLRDSLYSARSERVDYRFGFRPFDYQAEILDDPSSDVVVTCGRQVGKTETGGTLAADCFVQPPYEDVMIAAKWQETADEMLRRAKKHLANFGLGESDPAIEAWNKTEIESTLGARLYSKTLKVTDGDAGDNQRGKLPRVVILDESAILDGEAIEQVIRPMFLTHGTDHELYLFSTPRGKQGFHYEKHANDDSWSAHHVPSSANPLIDADYLEAERESTDELTWRQEYVGEFIDLGEVYIPAQTYDACVTPSESDTRAPRLRGERYLGVDVARKGKDRTVYLVMDEYGTVVASGIDAESKSDIPGIVSRIQTLHNQHGFRTVAIDENAVGGGVVDYASMGLGQVIEPVSFTTKSKSQMFRKLKADLEQGELTLPASDAGEHATRLRDETVNLQYDYTPNGHLKVHHAPGGKDDYSDALSLANKARTIQSAAVPEPGGTWYSPSSTNTRASARNHRRRP